LVKSPLPRVPLHARELRVHLLLKHRRLPGTAIHPRQQERIRRIRMLRVMDQQVLFSHTITQRHHSLSGIKPDVCDHNVYAGVFEMTSPVR